MPPRPLLIPLAALALIAGACAAATPAPEAPAPPSEPRATLRLKLDLERRQHCEEAFDLAVYQDRGVELIAWDEGSRCEGRTATVRYLPGRTTPANILRAAQQAGAKAQVDPR
jgi:hypothetical protein